MMKFWLASRPPEGMDRAQFDFEWSYIHVALMLTTPSVMRGFQRYAQQRTAEGSTETDLPYGRSPEDWYCISDHWLHSLEDLTAMFQGDDYPRRMHPHNFGDSAFVIELTTGALLYDQPTPFTGRGGVKLVSFLARSPEFSQEDFATTWRESYGPEVVKAASNDGHIKRYMQNPQLPLDASVFKGTLFEAGGVQTYAGIEELWFEDLAGLEAHVSGAGIDLGTQAKAFIDTERSFSMAVVERVVFDYTANPSSARPAIENPDSVEAQVLRQERAWGEWNKIQPVAP